VLLTRVLKQLGWQRTSGSVKHCPGWAHPPPFTSSLPAPAGTVLKRFDATKLYTLALQDVVERFHLLLVLGFVMVEEMGNRCASLERCPSSCRVVPACRARC
jgi:hypothetical protein